MKDAAPSQDTAPSSATEGGAPAVFKPTPAVGLLILGAVVVAIGIFVALAAALGIADIWVAFLFLLYWASTEKMQFAKLPGSIFGALLGLAIAFALHTLPASMGPAGWALVAVAILASIYFLVMGWWPAVVNNATMLFLTVGTIPLVQAGTSFLNLLPALGLGIAYFAGLAWLIQVFTQRAARK
jgi:hypothetical protein